MPTAIYFKSLAIGNVRAFAEEQNLVFTDSNGRPVLWTLIVGDNGVGKTTLLQCIARMRPVFNNRPDDEDGPPPLPVEPELSREENNKVFEKLARHGTVSTAQLKADICLFDTSGKSEKSEESISTHLEIKQNNGQISNVKGSAEPQTEYRKDTKDPLVLAYGAGRHPKADNLPVDADPIASLFNIEASLNDAEDFLYRLNYASMNDDLNARKRLNSIKKILSAIIEDIVHPESIQIFAPPGAGISPDKTGIRVDTPSGNVSFDQLSLGYQTVFSWITDIAWRLLDHYENSPDPLREPAVVIVDEIDLHLHPSWQRRIRKYLTEHFPNVQFIVTAHSPLMALSSLDTNVAVLRRSGDHTEIINDPDLVQGWRLDQLITSELFDLPSARSPEVEEMRARYRFLIGKRDLSNNEQEELDELQRREQDLPIANSPEEEKAMEIILRAAKRLESKDDVYDPNK